MAAQVSKPNSWVLPESHDFIFSVKPNLVRESDFFNHCNSSCVKSERMQTMWTQKYPQTTNISPIICPNVTTNIPTENGTYNNYDDDTVARF